MSRFPLFDLARDATLAVGAYVGVLREHVKTEWATVLGGSFDERVEEAKARMEAQADVLNEHEAENDGLEGDWELGSSDTAAVGGSLSNRCDYSGEDQNGRTFRCELAIYHHGRHRHGKLVGPYDTFEDFQAEQDASPAAAQRAGEPPEVEPSPTAPSGGSNPEWDEASVDEWIAADVRRHAAVVDALKLHRRRRRTGQCSCAPGEYLEHEYWYSHVAQHVMDALERSK